MANKNSAKERALTQVEKEIQRVENLYQKYANLYGGPPYRCARPVETVKYRVM
ncbi:MAG: hypothetical protein OEQ39_04470 [Gammaproteobacteria bacterium]|nr:hypothetical protein [Gammaproteobacteria bacterium]